MTLRGADEYLGQFQHRRKECDFLGVGIATHAGPGKLRPRKMNIMDISELIGKTLRAVTVNNQKDQMNFETVNGETYRMHHSQDCCESVTVEDIVGDLEDLVGSEILQAEESTSDKNPTDITKDFQDSFTWTFYRLSTIKGTVVIRWYGESNGYYSESVYFGKVA